MQHKFVVHYTLFLFHERNTFVKIKLDNLVNGGGWVMDLKEFGLYFANIREKSGYESQRQLSLASGVSNGTIARIEAGTQRVSPQTLRKLSPHLKEITYEELMVKAGYMPSAYIFEDSFISKVDNAARKDVPSEEPKESNEKPLNMAFLGGRKEILTEEEADAVELALEIFRKRKEERLKKMKQKDN